MILPEMARLRSARLVGVLGEAGGLIDRCFHDHAGTEARSLILKVGVDRLKHLGTQPVSCQQSAKVECRGFLGDALKVVDAGKS